ncbi:MAG TPA: hypothetical protein PKA00_18590 [Saprospiraceae bacterium]|nr:hypothetical protein [Saprospiraceae bacterium]HMQ84928.1 hypothetical protein [Saprospiraceae bacterium]
MKTKEGYVNNGREWIVLRNYSAATVGAYMGAMRQFLAWRD